MNARKHAVEDSHVVGIIVGNVAIGVPAILATMLASTSCTVTVGRRSSSPLSHVVPNPQNATGNAPGFTRVPIRVRLPFLIFVPIDY